MSALRFTKAQLLEALEARRPWAQKYDAANLAEHKKAEAKALREFKDSLRAALKWDYTTASTTGRYGGERLCFDKPNCPTSAEASLDRHLRFVNASCQKNYLVADKGTWAPLFWVLTHDETIKAEMC